MFEIQGFSRIFLLKKERKAALYRAERSADHLPVIFKTLTAEHPNVIELKSLKDEYDLLRQLPTEDVPQALQLIQNGDQNALVLADDGDVLLSDLIAAETLSIKQFLEIAIELAKTVGDLHNRSIIHKDIKPSNILVNLEKHTAKLIDFELVMLLPRQVQVLTNPEMLEGTLAYMSPEQTGRMNRSIDYRTDLYSLGVTFYEMLTGALPFKASDAMGMVHAHIAMKPIPMMNINHEIPEMINAIILKLMAKIPEERYQSAQGLKADLEACLNELTNTLTIKAFALGSQDISSQFLVSRKLYGREKELSVLLNSFEQVCAGETALVLVTGYAGLGKSTLINELHKPVTARRGYNCGGKFDQFQHDTPYSALIAALKQLINQILTESEENIAHWRIKLQQSLGENSGVIIKLIPELEFILGPQTSTEIEADEAEQHFYWIMSNFIQTFAQSNHPLVIHLDDMQWASPSSMKMVAHLLKSKIKYLLFVGAYRDNEITHSHPLQMALSDLEKEAVNVTSLSLKPLSLHNVEQLVADSLGQSVNMVKQLAKLCYEKTRGNPFFLNQLLTLLYEEGSIQFDSQHLTWSWDIEKIAKQAVTTNVVELMINKLNKLPIETQQILQLAACVGNNFDINMLTQINHLNTEQASAALWPALREGYITAYEENNNTPTEIHSQLCYQFAHDRIRQAAYLTINHDEKQIFHKKIGMNLLERTPSTQLESKVFDIVNHLHLALKLLVTPEERLKMAELAFMAGKKAMQAVVFPQSRKFLSTAIQMLPEDAWEKHYQLTKSIYMQAAETAYFSNQTVNMEKYAEEILDHATNTTDKVRIYEIMIDAYTKIGRTIKALNITHRALKEIKIQLPKKWFKMAILKEMMVVEYYNINKSVDQIVNLPNCQNERILSAIKILIKSLPAAQSRSVELLACIILKTVTLSLRYGNTTLSSIAYSMCTIIFWRMGNLSNVKKFSEIALQLADKFHAKKERSWTLFTIGSMVKPWIDHIQASQKLLMESYETAFDVGDVSFVGYNAFFYCLYKFWSGAPLDEILDETKQFLEAVKPFKQKIPLPSIMLTLQMIENLHIVREDSTVFTGSYMEEKSWIEPFIKTDNKLQVTAYYFLKLYFNYLFGNYAKAQEYSSNIEIEYFSGMYSYAMYHMFDALNRLALFDSLAKKEQKECIKKVKYDLKRLKKWSEYAPQNYLHKYYLVLAELARIKNAQTKASKYYNLAIEFAKKNQFIQDEALANELTGKFYLKTNKNLSKLYLQDAYYAYERWGSQAKMHHLEETYPELFSQTNQAIATHTSLDVETILKMSQVISKEIVIENLVKETLKIMIENMGADRCILLLVSDKELYIDGTYEIGKKALVLESIPISQYEAIPSTIVNYVKRTHQIVSINDVEKDKLFNRDPYIILDKPKSILCSPIIHHGELQGIFYFENRLTKDAFTPQRIELLKSLSIQIAISIENARLYHSFQRFVPQQFLQLLEKRNVVDVQLGDCIQKSLSILFMDIGGFTALSERLSPSEVYNFINTYLSYMEPIITKKAGFIDKYIGDGIMALFPQSADDAVSAAILLQQAIIEYNQQYHIIEGKINARIGINTGNSILGMLGSHHRIDGSVIGDAVNSASRIMDLNQYYGTSVLITGHTKDALKETYPMRMIDKVRVKGKSEIIPVWEVLIDASKDILSDLIETYNAAFAAYEKGDLATAKAKFYECIQLYPKDKVSQHFAKHCERLLTKGLPIHWEGVTTLTHK